MAHRRVRGGCEMWSSDEGKLDAKTRVYRPVLKSLSHNYIFREIRCLFFDITSCPCFFLL